MLSRFAEFLLRANMPFKIALFTTLLLFAKDARGSDLLHEYVSECAKWMGPLVTRLTLVRLGYDVDEPIFPGAKGRGGQDIPVTSTIVELGIFNLDDLGIPVGPYMVDYSTLSCSSVFRSSRWRGDQDRWTAPIRIGVVATDLQSGHYTVMKSLPVIYSHGMAPAKVICHHGKTLPPGRHAVTAVVLWEDPVSKRLYLLDHRHCVIRVPDDSSKKMANH